MTSNPTLKKVERACADLARDGRPLTYTAIATATGLSRSTLYRNAALRAIVEQHKHTGDGPLTPLTDEIATLRAAVTALADRVRSHDERPRHLTRNSGPRQSRVSAGQ